MYQPGRITCLDPDFLDASSAGEGMGFSFDSQEMYRNYMHAEVILSISVSPERSFPDLPPNSRFLERFL